MDCKKSLGKLVSDCREGERTAWEELFETYQPRLKYFIRRLDSDGVNMEDILQDIWLTVVEKIHNLNDTQSFAVWLYRIARNKVYDGFRRKERLVRLPEDDVVPVSESVEPVLNAQDAEQLHKALNTLKPHHREVLTLCFLEQMPYQSIAEVIGCNIGTVRSRLFYAKQALRKKMETNNGYKQEAT